MNSSFWFEFCLVVIILHVKPVQGVHSVWKWCLPVSFINITSEANYVYFPLSFTKLLWDIFTGVFKLYGAQRVHKWWNEARSVNTFQFTNFFFDNSHMQRFLKKKFRNTCTKGHINIDKSNKVKTIIQIVKLISRNQK